MNHHPIIGIFRCETVSFRCENPMFHLTFQIPHLDDFGTPTECGRDTYSTPQQMFGRKFRCSMCEFVGAVTPLRLGRTSCSNFFWLVVSTHLKNISHIESSPTIGVKIKNVWNHQLVLYNFFCWNDIGTFLRIDLIFLDENYVQSIIAVFIFHRVFLCHFSHVALSGFFIDPDLFVNPSDSVTGKSATSTRSQQSWGKGHHGGFLPTFWSSQILNLEIP